MISQISIKLGTVSARGASRPTKQFRLEERSVARDCFYPGRPTGPPAGGRNNYPGLPRVLAHFEIGGIM